MRLMSCHGVSASVAVLDGLLISASVVVVDGFGLKEGRQPSGHLRKSRLFRVRAMSVVQRQRPQRVAIALDHARRRLFFVVPGQTE